MFFRAPTSIMISFCTNPVAAIEPAVISRESLINDGVVIVIFGIG